MVKKIKEFLFHNKDQKQTVAKNTIWLSISNYGGRLVKAAIVIYGARVLDTAGYGVFSYALTLAGFVSLFLDPGINSILIRETAKASEEERKTIFSTTLVIKLVLVALGVLLVLFVAPSFSTLPGATALLPLVALILSFDTLRAFFTSLMDAHEHMQWDAAVNLLMNAAITVFGFWFLALRPDAHFFTLAYAIGTGVGALAALIVVFPYLLRSLRSFSLHYVGPVLKTAWPFAVIGALGVLLTNTDILIISWMQNATQVGIYSAVIRIVQIIYIIPGIIQAATLPAFARLAESLDRARFRAAFERTLGFIFLSSVPLALGGVLLGTQVMTLVFGGAYASGGLALKVLMVSMLFDFPTSVIAAAIFSYNHQKSLIVSSAIAGISNVALDLILIPHFGITGSAFATLGAQAISNTYLWHMMNRINPFSVVPKMAKVAVGGIGMMAVTATLFVLHAEVLVNTLVSAIVYFGILWLLREPLLREIKGILGRGAGAPAGTTVAQ
jgi:O-antigen/teichoic acid export membrane protein